MFLTLNCCLQLKYECYILYIYFYIDKVVLSESGEKYALFGLSFWWHPFTAEDPLVSKWCNAKFIQICPDE